MQGNNEIPKVPTSEKMINKYLYKNYSEVPIGEGECCPDFSKPIKPPDPAIVRVARLPTKLDAILSNPAYSDIVTWMPHGRAWKVNDSDRFLTEVTPLYFEYCNYNSFVRLVNAWGFRRISKGPDRNAYFHELFLRGLPHLHKKMHRLTSNDKKKPLKEIPDFYALSEKFALPTLVFQHENRQKNIQSMQSVGQASSSFSDTRVTRNISSSLGVKQRSKQENCDMKIGSNELSIAGGNDFLQERRPDYESLRIGERESQYDLISRESRILMQKISQMQQEISNLQASLAVSPQPSSLALASQLKYPQSQTQQQQQKQSIEKQKDHEQKLLLHIPNHQVQPSHGQPNHQQRIEQAAAMIQAQNNQAAATAMLLSRQVSANNALLAAAVGSALNENAGSDDSSQQTIQP
mmetsp:Transcript_5183/g.5889  ORF Transcript_5183/g.5889 Transcript_5183/m.5889 type:complete len:407 (-) Transcript_5183:120-1340(-)|eukprot:CAMPEP_0194387692 /NCGR_PEP_ID=MMETSP0174-20130528/93906_1 /TAXON_ID=216777 /ORGANISM="Proboscia alata, Strain PI-D3" /LENGTH=406 /DNA_ID=CAMNT_0039178151 /DNA_START=59 /DNA_END=1279 /DNA_ORIENTATION=-